MARARDLAERISTGEFYTMSQLVAYSGNIKQYVRRILRLAALMELIMRQDPAVSPIEISDQAVSADPQRRLEVVAQPQPDSAPLKVTYRSIQGGHSDGAYALAKGSVLASMYMGISPGNVGTMNLLDVYRRESQRDSIRR